MASFDNEWRSTYAGRVGVAAEKSTKVRITVTTEQFRIERDSIGEMQIPADAYWGVNTARAVENFDIARRQISVYPDFIVGFAQVKQAAARANKEIGVLDAERADLIDRACEDVINGERRCAAHSGR